MKLFGTQFVLQTTHILTYSITLHFLGRENEQVSAKVFQKGSLRPFKLDDWTLMTSQNASYTQDKTMHKPASNIPTNIFGLKEEKIENIRQKPREKPNDSKRAKSDIPH